MPAPTEVAQIRNQLNTLKLNYGTPSAMGATFEDLNQGFTANQIDLLVDEILANLELALKLVEESDTKRYKKTKQGLGSV
jgi:hypothetical protein